MILKFCAVGVCAAAIVASAFAASPAEAAQKKKRVASQTKQEVVKTQPRARITVRNRSFLDAGTDSLPGDRKFTDYAFPPVSYSGMNILENTSFYRRSPLPGPFDLPSPNNPVRW